MKHLQKILLALLVWGIAATGNSFAQLPPGSAGCDCLLTDKRSYP